MTKERDLNPSEIWGTLNETEQEACAMLGGAGDWQSGHGIWYLKAIEIGDEIISNLVNKGILEAKPGYVYAQEWLDENKQKVEELISKKFSDRTEEDRDFLNDARLKENVSKDKDEELRYRLFSKDFHDFANSQLEDDE